jgi:hypothetical protein
MPEPMHYLPAQKVDKAFPQRLTLRGEDVDTLADILKKTVDEVDVTSVEFSLINRVMEATGHWGHDEWDEEPLED